MIARCARNEAQVTIDTGDCDTSLKDSLERIRTLEPELLAERKEGETLKEKLLMEQEKRQIQLQLHRKNDCGEAVCDHLFFKKKR